MTRSAYWYPLNDWEVGDGPPSAEHVAEMALRFQTMGVTDLILGIDGRKLNATWNYLVTFDSQTFRADLTEALDRLFEAGYAGNISFMPVNGLYNWQEDNHARTFWAVNATLRFIETSAHRDKITGVVTDTEFAPTEEWRSADAAGRADILRQYVELLEGINTRVKALDPDLSTATYHGSYLDKGTPQYVQDGVDYSAVEVLAQHVDMVILPIRLTDEIDPEADHDFDRLISRAVSQTADELAGLAGTGKTILVDFEWEEAHRGMGAPNYFQQIERAVAQALTQHPNFEGFTVWISTQQSTVPLRDLEIRGSQVADLLRGTQGHDTILGAGGDDSLLSGRGNDRGQGDHGADLLDGGAGHDTLDGGAGSDVLLGGDGNDRLRGGYGADSLLGGNHNDRLFSGDGHDLLQGGAGRDLLNGGRHDDRLEGGIGGDTLKAGAGQDRLLGGADDDWMSGGRGADAFVFEGQDFGDDTVADFAAGEDQLVFDPSEVATFAAFEAALTTTDQGLVYDLGADGINRILLRGLAEDALSAEDVIFLS